MWTKLIQEHIMTTQLMIFFQDCLYARGTEMILKCYVLFERQYKQMRKIFFPCVKSQPKYLI